MIVYSLPVDFAIAPRKTAGMAQRATMKLEIIDTQHALVALSIDTIR
jgi:hypothetical protein